MKIIRNKIYNNHSVSFGWLAKTHSYLTGAAISTIPELIPYKKCIQLGTIMPDIRISETSIFGSEAHYWDGKNFSNFDLTPQNASDFYFDSITKAFRYLDLGHKKFAMYKFGEALHFLQDMAVYYHTKREGKKISKIFPHINYEFIAGKNHDFINKLASKNNIIKIEPFCDIFNNTFMKSSSLDNPFEKQDKSKLQSHIEYSLENAFTSTYSFLKKIARIAKPSIPERNKLMLDEITHIYNLQASMSNVQNLDLQ